MSAERAKPTEVIPMELVGPADVASWQSKLRAVVLDTVTEDRIRNVMEAVLKRAEEGDLQAARMILAYAIGHPPRDERGDGPSRARPGSKAKLDALAYRHVNGMAMHHPDDAKFGTDD